MAHSWDPGRFTLGTLGHIPHAFSERPQEYKDLFATILLNQPMESPELIISLHYNAFYTMFADGAANHFRESQLGGDVRFDLIPDAICGDFDSVRLGVAQYYDGWGTKLLKDSDQYSTDLMKCLKQIGKVADERLTSFNKRHAKWHKATSVDIVVLGGLGGRSDQAFSQLHHLYLASNAVELKLGDIYLITPSGIIFLLKKGLNWIKAPVAPGFFTENVGIIPLGRPSIITTKGLEWDVTDWETEFGTQLSTSNHIKADLVEITTTERVLLTMEFADVEPTMIPERPVKRIKKENEPPKHL